MSNLRSTQSDQMTIRLLDLHHLLATGPSVESETKSETDKLAKNVKWLKENVVDTKKQLDTSKEKLGLLSKKANEMSLSNAMKKEGKPEVKAQTQNLFKAEASAAKGFSWASIKEKLPGWQIKIADMLQRMQDLVFKKRK